MNFQLIVDSIEGNWARVETADGSLLNLPTAWLPQTAKESTVLRVSISGNGDTRTLVLELDAAATETRLNAMRNLRDTAARGPSGDIDL